MSRTPIYSLTREVRGGTRRKITPLKLFVQGVALSLSLLIAFPVPAIANDVKCVKVFQKNSQKLMKAWSKTIGRCIRDADANNVPSAEECIAEDPGSKISKAKTKLIDQSVGGEKDKCDGQTPAFGHADPFFASEGVAQRTYSYAHSLFGDPFDQRAPNGDKELAKCRKLLWNGASKLVLAMSKERAACTVAAVKDGVATAEGLLDTCFSEPGIYDPNGRIADRQEKFLNKLTAANCAEETGALVLAGGQRATAIQYGLIAALIAVVIIGALTALGAALATTFDNPAGDFSGSGESEADFLDDRAINNSHLVGRSSEIVIANNSSDSRICLNTGGGGAGISCSGLGDGVQSSNAVVLGSLDTSLFPADESDDLMFAGDLDNRLCMSNGDGTFACVSQSEGALDNDVAVARLDWGDDSGLDAILARGTGAYVCLSQAAGGFGACAQIPGENSDSRAVAIGDLNGDGRADAVFANSGQPDRVCLETESVGVYSFSCADVDAANGDSRAVAVAPLDAGPSVDAVFATMDGRNRICLNHGSGVFTCSDVGIDTNSTTGVAVADADMDGDVDLIFSNNGSQNRLCLNVGSANFLCSDLDATVAAFTAVSVGDIDEDGYQDAVFAVDGGPNLVCYNSAGTFACSNIEADVADTKDVAVGTLAVPTPPPYIF